MPSSLEAREYQRNIAEAVCEENSIVALPTGLGKTVIALLVGEKRLNTYKDGKILLLAPTKPLATQHAEFFSRNGLACRVLTGEDPPESRRELWTAKNVTSATPQTVLNDIKAGRLSLEPFVLVVFDEAHRCVRDYSYTELATRYMKEAKHPLILGLTASPGSSREKVEEVARNLYAKRIEARTEQHADVKPYVENTSIKTVPIELPRETREISSILKSLLEEKFRRLVELGIISPIERLSKRTLFEARNRILEKMKATDRRPYLFGAMLLQAQAVIVQHALELAESQGLETLSKYLSRLKDRDGRASKSLLKDDRWASMEAKVEEAKGRVENPKLDALHSILKEQSFKKAIVFSQYRDTLNEILDFLGKNGFKASRFVGQANREEDAGLNQRMQQDVIRSFENGEFDILVSSSIGEEGLHIPDVDLVVFYEAVPSEIRAIQRRGRTGRTSAGSIFVLLAKDTIDEIYYYSSRAKERKMMSLIGRYGRKAKTKNRGFRLTDYMSPQT